MGMPLEQVSPRPAGRVVDLFLSTDGELQYWKCR